MQRITFHNNQNGLEYTFATDTPRALLAAFDGNSLGAEFVQFKPVGFDGSKTSSYTLNARTITFTADWYAVEGGKRSREKALAEWEKIQYVFAPGHTGVLTWTNGTETRTIECYSNETPALHEKARGLFTADFTLTADYPLWRGSVQHTATLSSTYTVYEIENTCPIAVPPLVKFVNGKNLSIVMQSPVNSQCTDLKLQSALTTEIYIDNAKRCAYSYNSAGVMNDYTHRLTPQSKFFSLYPGVNKVSFTSPLGSAPVVTFIWFDHYMGVSK